MLRATILLWLSILMPPEMMPVSTMPPLRKVLLLTEMPPAPMVPGVGHAAAEGGMADHHGAGVAAERRGIGPVKAKRAPRCSVGPISLPPTIALSARKSRQPGRHGKQSLSQEFKN